MTTSSDQIYWLAHRRWSLFRWRPFGRAIAYTSARRRGEEPPTQPREKPTRFGLLDIFDSIIFPIQLTWMAVRALVILCCWVVLWLCLWPVLVPLRLAKPYRVEIRDGRDRLVKETFIRGWRAAGEYQDEVNRQLRQNSYTGL